MLKNSSPTKKGKKKKEDDPMVSILDGSEIAADMNQIEAQGYTTSAPTPTDIKIEDYEQYIGDAFNPQGTIDIDKYRAQQQGTGQQFLNALGQTAVGTTGDLIGGFGYLLDAPDTVIDWVRGEQVEFGNALSELGTSLSDWSRESMPIYQEDPESFNPLDPAWAAANIPSIFSTISLAIPAMTATKGLKWFSRAVRSAKELTPITKLAKAADGIGELSGVAKGLNYGDEAAKMLKGLSRKEKGNLFVNMLKSTESGKTLGRLKQAANDAGINSEMVANAFISRYGENMMEGVSTYKEQVDRLMANGVPEEKARQAAAKAFNTQFKMNSAFLLQDIFTFKLLGNASKAIRNKSIGKTIDSPVTWRQSIGEMTGEGAEEWYQNFTGEEASYIADLESGLGREISLADRLSNANTGEAWTAAVFGALGSGVFRGIGKHVNAYADNKLFNQTLEKKYEVATKIKGEELTEDEIDEIETTHKKQWDRRNSEIVLNLQNANEYLNEEIQEAYRQGRDISDLVMQKEINAALMNISNRSDKDKSDYTPIISELSKLSEEEFEKQKGNLPMTKEQVDHIAEKIDRVNEIYQRNAKYGQKEAVQLSIHELNTEFLKEKAENKQQEIDERLNEDKSFQRLSNKEAERQVYNRLEAEGLKKDIEALEKKNNSFLERKNISSLKKEDLSSLEENDSKRKLLEQKKKELEQKNKEFKEWKNKDNPKESHEADKRIINSLSPVINELSEKQSAVNATQDRIDRRIESTNKIKELLEEEKKQQNKAAEKEKKSKEETNKEKSTSEDQDLSDYNVDDKISTPINSEEDVDAGDIVTFEKNNDNAYEVQEDDNGKYIEQGETKAYINDLPDSINLFKHKDPEQEIRKQKEDVPPWETDPDDIIIDEYEENDTSSFDSSKKSTILSFAWKSEHNTEKTDEDRGDPDEVARTQFAQRKESVLNNDGSKYYIRFETDENVNSEEGGIRAYIIDSNKNQVYEEVNGEQIPVYFWIHEPSFAKNIYKKDADGNIISTEAIADEIRKERQKILDILSEGKTPIAPVTEKTAGQIEYKKETQDYDLLTILQETNHDNVDLYVLNKQLMLVDNTGSPKQVRFFEGKESQVGRVYTSFTALNGITKVLPLERATLSDPMIDTVFSIMNDVLYGDAKMGSTISDQIWNSISFGFENNFQDSFNGRIPTYKEVLDRIVLEGPITKRSRNPEKKRFHINFDKKIIEYGNNSMPLSAFQNKESKDKLREFLQTRRINVLKSELNNPAYKKYLIDGDYDRESGFLLQNVNLGTDQQTLLRQPTLKFGNVYPQDENTSNEGDLSEGEQQDLFNTSQEDSNTETNTDNLDEDLLGGLEQRLPNNKTESLIPVLEGLSKRFGIKYVLFNNPEKNFAGLYKNNTVYINTAKAGDDTPFHEFAHPFIRQIKNNSPIIYAKLTSEIAKDSKYKSIYSDVKRNYPEYNPQQLVEETLVQIIGQKAATNSKTQGFIEQLWNKIKEYISAIFGGVNVNDLSENTTLNDIANIVANKYVNIERSDLTAYQLKPDNMRNNEWNSWVNGLMYMLLAGNNVTDYSNADNISFDIVRERLSNSNNKKVQQIYNDLFTEEGINKDSVWYIAINDKLAAFNISPETDQSIDENSPDFTPDYLYSGKEKASTFIKMMFSTIPKISSVRKDGSFIYDKNDSTGLREFHNFNDIWNLTSKLLADTVESFESGAPQDIFNRFIEKLNEFSEFRPEIEVIINRLQDAPYHHKAQFVTTFFKANQNYTLILYDGQFKIQKNTPTSVESKVASQWIQQFESRWFNQEGDISKRGKEKLLEKYNSFKSDWLSYYSDQHAPSGPIPNRYKEKFIEILDNLGFEFSEKSLDYMLKKHIEREGGNQRDALDYFIRESGLNHILTGTSGLQSLNKKRDTNFIEDQAFSKTLIEAEAYFRQDFGNANVFGPNNNIYWNFSSMSAMTKQLQYYKENPDKLDALKELPFYGRNGEVASLWAKHVDKLEITNNYGYKKEGSVSSKMKSSGEIDRLIIDINKALSGQFSMMARGANATEFNISGAPVIKSYIDRDGEIRLNVDAFSTLFNYIYDEIDRVRYEKQYIENEKRKEKEAKKNDEEYIPQLIDGYHTEVSDPSTGKKYIPATKVFLMPNIFNDLGFTENMSREQFKKDPDLYAELANKIQEAFNQRVQNVYDFIENNDISEDQLNKLITTGKDSYDTSNPLKSKLYDYVFNGMVANIEQQKLFAADTAMFGSVENMQKRILANGTAGIQSYISNPEDEFYNSATIADVSYDSKTWDNYKGVEITDAQAWITLPLYVELMEGYGKWGQKEQDALDRIQSGNYRREDIEILSIQSRKLTHFERVKFGNRIMPSYDKQTVFPLIPELVQGTSLQNLLDNMIAQEVDHVIVSSGKKLGRVSPAYAIDNETGQFKESFELSPVPQSKRFTFLQTEMPSKGIKPQTQGSQQKWNILSVVDPSMEIFDKNAVSEVHRIQGAISDVRMDDFMDSITTDEKIDKAKLYQKLINLSKSRIIDRDLIDLLEQQLPIEAIPSANKSLQYKIMSLMNGLSASYDFSNQFVGIQTSVVGFNDLSKDQRGAIDWLEKDITNLSPPQIKDGKLIGGSVLIPHSIVRDYNLDLSKKEDREKAKNLLQAIGYRIPNQSISNIAPLQVVGILPEYMGDNIIPYGEMVEQMGSDNDGDKVYAMLYNLETTNAEKIKYWSETDNKKATLKEIWKYRKSVLNENIADEAEFIDKYKERDILAAQSQKQVENYLLDAYHEILSDPEVFEKMKQKLESDELKDLITSHSQYEKREIGDLEFASPFFQIEMRNSFLNANSGVGQDSNHSIDHIKSQNKNIYARKFKTENNIRKEYSWKIKGANTNTTTNTSDGNEAILFDEKLNVEGKSIHDIISMFMTAHVDAESDDYAPRGNFNTETNGKALTMIRAGMPLSDVVDIVGSESVRTYVKNKLKNKNIFINEKRDGFVNDPLRQTAIDLGYYEETDEGIATNEGEMIGANSELRIYRDFETLSTAMNQSIQLTRFSINGGGRSFASSIALMLFKNSMIENLANTKAKFYESAKDGRQKSMEQTAYENIIETLPELFGNQSIAFHESFMNALYLAEQQTDFSVMNMITGDTNSAEDLYDGFYNYIMSGVFDDVNRDDLIRGENNVATRVANYDKDNAFINHLIPYQEGRGDAAIHFLETTDQSQVDEELAKEMKEGWEDLYNDDPKLALDIARLGYFQSGFKRNRHSIHEYMPQIVQKKLKIAEKYIQIQQEDYFDGFLEQYIRHNADNNALVPMVGRNDFITKKDHYLITTKNHLNKLGEPKQFLKIKKFMPGGHYYTRLIEFIGKSDDGFMYKDSPELGYPEKGVYFYEYDINKKDKNPMFSQIPYPAQESIAKSEQQQKQSDNKDWQETDNNDSNPLCP